jgi:hypothetical protein
MGSRGEGLAFYHACRYMIYIGGEQHVFHRQISHTATERRFYTEMSARQARHRIAGLSREHDKERNNLYFALLVWRNNSDAE